MVNERQHFGSFWGFFAVLLDGVVSYLLVAILPGEVQEAGGEQLIFGPGITVHGVSVCAPAVSVVRTLRSSYVSNGGFFCLLMCLPSTTLSLPLALCACRVSLVPLASPSGAVEAVKRAAAVCLAAASLHHVVGGFSPKNKSGMLGFQCGVRGPLAGSQPQGRECPPT